MKIKRYVLLTLIAIGAIMHIGCGSPDLTVALPEAIADKGISFGNPDADTVIINTQGGPMPELLGDEILDIFPGLDNENTLLVNVHQAQTLAPQKYTEQAITFEQAKEADAESVAILAEVVKHFKEAGKTVYVTGISFGAFMVQDLLVTQGNVADGYLIIVGRLEMPSAVWETFADGRMVGFENGVDIVPFSAEEAGMGGNGTFTDANMARIAAGLGHKRYSELLAETDLNNVVYGYGKTDEQVGRLTQAELNFLDAKGVTVLTAEGGHGETISELTMVGLEIFLR